jgi:predicted nucleic acid-binding protein
MTSAAALRAGTYRFDFKRRGQTLATADALIAAMAREYEAVLLTENPRHFPMDDIEVRSFRS